MNRSPADGGRQNIEVGFGSDSAILNLSNCQSQVFTVALIAPIMLFESDGKQIFYSSDRLEWRKWLENNFEAEEDIWFAFPLKDSG